MKLGKLNVGIGICIAVSYAKKMKRSHWKFPSSSLTRANLPIFLIAERNKPKSIASKK